MMSDPIADMLTRIRNAQLVRRIDVTLPHSKLKHRLADLLVREGYLEGVHVENDHPSNPSLVIRLKYHLGKPVIARIWRESSPGLRHYVKSSNLPRVLGGLGVAIVSTSKGLMTDRQARAAGVGGEVICCVH